MFGAGSAGLRACPARNIKRYLYLLLYTIDYLDEALGPLPADALAAERETRAAEAIRIWQSLVVGTTRFNPVTDKEMVAQTLSARMNVVEMWRQKPARK